MNTVSSQMDENIMGSYNHSYLQAHLTWLFKNLGAYAVFTELSLDTSALQLTEIKELKPDICLYPPRGLMRADDLLKMTEPPLLIIEIVSPKQNLYDLIQKFKLYFALGVQSCWLVEPMLNVVSIYPDMQHSQSFVSGEVIDSTLNIRIPIAQIFI